MTELDKLADWFEEDAWPTISCPVCLRGDLAPVSVLPIDTGISQRLRAHEAFEPEWIAGFFTAHLKCQRGGCDETAVALGDMKVDYSNHPDDTWDGQYATFLQLRHVLPAPPLVEVVEACPEPVRDRLNEAALVIWSDANAAANRLRLAVEEVLDDQSIDRVAHNGHQLKTHARIERFRSKNARVADALEAVKWIGNQGSHEDSLTRADVVAGAQILAHALELLYDTKQEELRRRVEVINTAKRVPRPDARP
ncbi:DUF4145 domain-containing protein [Cellulomonas sp. P22]|uniref:DUF4145 domain-containing protein n=1 Tax=Cellulomonas sp. P22 TaxID=3373189 RepID=UPI0037A60FF1